MTTDGPCFFDMQKFSEALTYATCLHARQTRKGSDLPYISHLLAVSSIAMEYGANESEAIAALLHDAVEDQGGRPTLDNIRAKFGDAVADIVDGCSDAYAQAGAEKPPWDERKAKYIAHLRSASKSVRLVSAADKLHNARAILADYREIGDEVFARFKKSKHKTLWYYRTLANTYKEVLPGYLADELDRTVATLEEAVSANSDSQALAERAQVNQSLNKVLDRELTASQLEQAILLAVQAHQGQRDKAGMPYILHPLRMMAKMNTEAEMMTAVLHDVVEDTECTVEQLREKGFPEEVLKAVECLTKREGEDYMAFVERAKSNRLARQVKVRDLEDNMDVRRISNISARDTERIAKYNKAWHLLVDPEGSSNGS